MTKHYKLVIHRFAPELSRVYVKNTDVTAYLLKRGLDLPRLASIPSKQAQVAYMRATMRGLPHAQGVQRHVNLQFNHTTNTSCDRAYNGLFRDSLQLLGTIKTLKKRHNLPDCTMRIRFSKYNNEA